MMVMALDGTVPGFIKHNLVKVDFTIEEAEMVELRIYQGKWLCKKEH